MKIQMSTIKWLKLGAFFKHSSLSMFVLVSSAVIAFAQPSSPTPQNLPYVQDFGNEAITTSFLTSSIVGMQFARAASGSYQITQAAVETAYNASSFNTSFSNRSIQGEIDNTTVSGTARAFSTTDAGDWNTINGLGPLSYVAGTDAKLAFSLGSRTFENLLSLNTIAKQSIKFSYEIQLVEYINYNTLETPTVTGSVFLQYSVGSTGDWVTIPNTTYTTTGAVDGVSTFSGYLPAAAENKPSVQLRWVTFQSDNTADDYSDYITFSLDNISITGTTIEGPSTVTATNLSIAEVSPIGTSEIIQGKPFKVTVQSLDNTSTPFAVTEPTTITLAVFSGSGTLSGTFSGIINASTTSTIIYGVIYSEADNLVLAATVAAGQPLISVTSASFAVVTDPLQGLSILYKEDFESTSRTHQGVTSTLPGIPSNMKMYNIDGQPSVESDGYPQYGTDAFVMVRRTSKGIDAFGDDDVLQYGTKLYYFDNSASAYPDSNWVAAGTSYFTATQSISADRWLITPQISLTGNNIKLSLQAMSGTSSGNYEDQFEVYYSYKPLAASFTAADWLILKMHNNNIIVPAIDSTLNSAPTLPNTYTFNFPSTVKGLKVYIAVRLATGHVFGSSFGGDRLYVDNILVTSGGAATGFEDEIVKPAALSVYPNPALGSITISDHKSLKGTIEISDLSGKSVISSDYTGSKTIDLSGISSGIYIVKLHTPSGVLVSKFIKE